MREVCCECGILFGVKEPLNNDCETGGICEWCFPWVMAKVEHWKEERRKAREKGKEGDKCTPRLE